uniref:Uncharacterized protein n=1 Tax=Romanomermis culicivorax TaxID=13658 RepID=A0A915HPS1_ROMCU
MESGGLGIGLAKLGGSPNPPQLQLCSEVYPTEMVKTFTSWAFTPNCCCNKTSNNDVWPALQQKCKTPLPSSSFKLAKKTPKADLFVTEITCDVQRCILNPILTVHFTAVLNQFFDDLGRLKKSKQRIILQDIEENIGDTLLGHNETFTLKKMTSKATKASPSKSIVQYWRQSLCSTTSQPYEEGGVALL